MIHELDEIQSMLRDAAQSVCADLNKGYRAGSDLLPDLWRQATEMGWLGIALPEEHGGAGGGPMEAGVVASEMARAALFGGYSETAAISVVLSRAPAGVTPAGRELAHEAASGEAELRFLQARSLNSNGKDESLVLSLSAPRAYAVLRREDGAILAGSLSERTEAVRTTARTRDVALSAAQLGEPKVLAKGQSADDIWRAALLIRKMLAAAELCGAVRALLDMAIEYSRIRSQFGHPIGSYQAVQHALVDILSGVDAAEMLAFDALSALNKHPLTEPPIARSAIAYARETSWSALMKTYDVFGGVAFVEEHSLSRYTRGMLPLFTVIGPAAELEEAVANNVRGGLWLPETVRSNAQ